MLTIENHRQLVLANITDDNEIILATAFFDYLDDASDDAIIPDYIMVDEIRTWLDNYWYNNTPNHLYKNNYAHVPLSDYINDKIEKYLTKNHSDRNVKSSVYNYLDIYAANVNSYKAAINRLAHLSTVINTENPITETMLYNRMDTFSGFCMPASYIIDAIQREVIPFPYKIELTNDRHFDLFFQLEDTTQQNLIRSFIQNVKTDGHNLNHFFKALYEKNSTNFQYAISYFLEYRKELNDIHYEYLLGWYLSVHTQDADVKKQLLNTDLVLAVLDSESNIKYQYTWGGMHISRTIHYAHEYVNAVQYIYEHTPEKVDATISLYLEKYYRLGYREQLTRYTYTNDRKKYPSPSYNLSYCRLIDYLESVYDVESVKYIILALNNPNHNKLTESDAKVTVESMFYLLSKYVGRPEFGKYKQVLLMSLLGNKAPLMRKLAVPLCAKYPELAKQVATELLLHKKKDMRTTGELLLSLIE